MLGLTIPEVAKELGISDRTVRRMLNDGRLTGERVALPSGGAPLFVWIIDPMSIARIQYKKLGKRRVRNG